MNLFSKYLILIITIIFFLAGCKKVETSHLTNLNNNVISVLGHRGSGISFDNTYPMNSLESIEVGIDEMGADGIETDAQLSKDNFMMLYHDNDLITMTSCNGLINSHTKDELGNCIISSAFFNDPFKVYHMATLEEFFEKYNNYSPLPICYIDIKPYYDTVNFQSYADYVLAYSQTMNTLISKYNRYENTLLSSGDTYMLQRLQMISPSLKLTIDNPDFNMAFQIATSLGLFGITINYKNITRAMVEKAHANNLRIILWGVNTKSECRQTASLFPDYVETDNVLYMLSLAK